MGDPGVAKSQMLAYIDRLAPRSKCFKSQWLQIILACILEREVCCFKIVGNFIHACLLCVAIMKDIQYRLIVGTLNPRSLVLQIGNSMQHDNIDKRHLCCCTIPSLKGSNYAQLDYVPASPFCCNNLL